MTLTYSQRSRNWITVDSAAASADELREMKDRCGRRGAAEGSVKFERVPVLVVGWNDDVVDPSTRCFLA
jgi:hypothetical protein